MTSHGGAQSAQKTATVMVVDDHAVVREGIEGKLREHFHVVLAKTGPEALALYGREKPDLVLCDLSLGRDMSGIELAQRLVRQWPEAVVVAFSTYDDREHISAALDAGMRGYLHKMDTTGLQLVEHVRSALAGEEVFGPSIVKVVTSMWRTRDERPASPILSRREAEVLALLCEGVTSTTDIAERLLLSENSVKTHLSRMYGKLGVSDKAQAVVMAYKSGLGPPTSDA